jgi:hypothetical protein
MMLIRSAAVRYSWTVTAFGNRLPNGAVKWVGLTLLTRKFRVQNSARIEGVFVETSWFSSVFPDKYAEKYYKLRNRHSDQATAWMVENLGFDSLHWQEIFLFSRTFRPTLGPTQFPTQWVPGAVFWGLKRPGREADHSPTSAMVKKMGLYIHSPICLHGVVPN